MNVYGLGADFAVGPPNPFPATTGLCGCDPFDYACLARSCPDLIPASLLSDPQAAGIDPCEIGANYSIEYARDKGLPKVLCDESGAVQELQGITPGLLVGPDLRRLPPFQLESDSGGQPMTMTSMDDDGGFFGGVTDFLGTLVSGAASVASGVGTAIQNVAGDVAPLLTTLQGLGIIPVSLNPDVLLAQKQAQAAAAGAASPPTMMAAGPDAGSPMDPVMPMQAGVGSMVAGAAAELLPVLVNLIKTRGPAAARALAETVGAIEIFNQALELVGLGGGDAQQVATTPIGGTTMGPSLCPALFRTRGGTGMYIPSRVQVVGPDGQIYVLANLGRATRGSRETSVMKRLAKQNGFVTRRRTSPR